MTVAFVDPLQYGGREVALLVQVLQVHDSGSNKYDIGLKILSIHGRIYNVAALHFGQDSPQDTPPTHTLHSWKQQLREMLWGHPLELLTS